MKLTVEHVNSRIEKKTFTVLEGTTTMVCAITIDNGFVVTGTSACIDPADFDQQVGETLAFEDAKEKVWELLGFLEKEKLHLKRGLVPESETDHKVIGQDGTELN